MTLRLHGFSASNYYNVAKLALLEKQLDFEEVEVYTGAGRALSTRLPRNEPPGPRFPACRRTRAS